MDFFIEFSFVLLRYFLYVCMYVCMYLVLLGKMANFEGSLLQRSRSVAQAFDFMSLSVSLCWYAILSEEYDALCEVLGLQVAEKILRK